MDVGGRPVHDRWLWRGGRAPGIYADYVDARGDDGRLLVFTHNRSDFAYSLWINDLSTGGWSAVRTDISTDPGYWLWTGHQLIDAYGYDVTRESDGGVVSLYDVDTDRWSMLTGPPIDSGRGTFAALGPDGQVFVWGDLPYNPEDEEMTVPYDHGLAFDPASAQWTEIAMIETSWWECSANSAVAGRLVYLETCLDKVWFDPDAGTMTEIDWPPSLSSERVGSRSDP